jgi:cytochrome c oxidase assembly protein subunit 11
MAITTDATHRRWLVGKLAAVSVAMFGFGYLLSPIYLSLCRVTGVNRLQTADALPSDARSVASRTVLMQFDSNLRDGLPWEFRPTQTTVQIHPGQLVRASYDVHNNSDRTITGQAIASYAPAGAASYVRKLECFCFSMQTLAPHEVRQMPVVFMVAPSLPSDVAVVTLSYTFFEVPGRRAQADKLNRLQASQRG